MSNKTMLARVDREIWFKARTILPNTTDKEISKILFNTSLAKLEYILSGKKSINKKGSLIDVLYWGVILFFFAFVVFICTIFITEFNTAIQASGAVPAMAKTVSTDFATRLPGAFDDAYLFLLFGLVSTTFVLAGMVRVHPAFFILFIFGVVGVTFFSGIITQMYQLMAANPALITTANRFIYIPYIMNYLPLITGVFGSLLAVVMYKNWSNAQQ